MHRLKAMKERLIECVECEMNDLARTDTHELGEVIDMIKDLEEAIFYCHKIKMMEDKSHHMCHCIEVETQEHEHEHMEERDAREGTSPLHRKHYLAAKESHSDKQIQMDELEKYLKELAKDITEMIKDASPEEILLLKQKLTTLTDKIK